MSTNLDIMHSDHAVC